MTMKIAIVHDGLATFGGRGGAEWVLTVLNEMFPDAPIFTTVYNEERMPAFFHRFDIRTSSIQRLPFARTKYKAYLPLMPSAVEQLDLRGYDVVLSCNHSVIKGVITAPETRHLCYCYTPLRYAWDMYHEYMETSWRGRLSRFCIPPLLTYMRAWDTFSSDRVDKFIAISHYVAQRIRKYYRRESVVIYPPIDTSAFTVSQKLKPYFLVVSRLEPYKRIDLAVQAFNKLGLPLVIIGDGSERASLEALAQQHIKFLGRRPDDVVRQHLATCQALIFPGEEDFGITPVEAQASGRPVIAYRAGGALETVTEQSGNFFFPKSVEALTKSIRHFDPGRFDSAVIQAHARQFDLTVFRRKMLACIEDAGENDKLADKR